MKLYKDSNNNIYAYELDGSQDHLIGDKVSVTQAEVDAMNAAKEQEYLDSISYAEKRQAEYPDFKDYLDGVVKGDQVQIDKYIADCLTVKAKYPKGTN
tara:strand:- start:93 stop:386 length:294 start_codon:yes stop_codon:yes gene_type:complete